MGEQNMPHHLDFEDSIHLDPAGRDQREPECELTSDELNQRSSIKSNNPDGLLQRSSHAPRDSKLKPEDLPIDLGTANELEQIKQRRDVLETQLRLELESKKAELEKKLNMSSNSPERKRRNLPAVSDTPLRSRTSVSPQKSRSSPLNSPTAKSPPTRVVRPMSELDGERGVPVQWDTLDI